MLVTQLNTIAFIVKQVEIATLEATVKSELEEKNEILDQLMKERGLQSFPLLCCETVLFNGL